MKEYNEGFFLEVDFQYHKKLHELHWKSRKVTNLHDKADYVIHIKKLKQILDDCYWTRTQSHLVLKRTLNHLGQFGQMV